MAPPLFFMPFFMSWEYSPVCSANPKILIEANIAEKWPKTIPVKRWTDCLKDSCHHAKKSDINLSVGKDGYGQRWMAKNRRWITWQDRVTHSWWCLRSICVGQHGFGIPIFMKDFCLVFFFFNPRQPEPFFVKRLPEGRGWLPPPSLDFCCKASNS